MEKIQDFFKHVGERLSNPFLFSFLISWLISNYKVTIGLLFYSIPELKADGYSSYLDLIAKSVTWCTGLVYPLIGAGLYTFAFPYLKRFIALLYIRINQGQEKKTLDILKDGYISTEKYLRLREDYKQSQDQLVKVIDEESEFLKKRGDLMLRIENLRKESTEANNKIESLENELAPLKALKEKTDISFMAGTWQGTSKRRGGNGKAVEMKINLTEMKLNLVLDDFQFPEPLEISNLIRNGKTILIGFSPKDGAQFPVDFSRYIMFSMSHEHQINGWGFNGETFKLTKRID